MTTIFTSTFRAVFGKGCSMVVESRGGREIGWYSFKSFADAADYARSRNADEAERTRVASLPKPGDVVTYRGKSGKVGRYEVLATRQQKWTSHNVGPRGFSASRTADVVDLRAQWSKDVCFTVPVEWLGGED